MSTLEHMAPKTRLAYAPDKNPADVSKGAKLLIDAKELGKVECLKMDVSAFRVSHMREGRVLPMKGRYKSSGRFPDLIGSSCLL
jgi:hypothetical protein